VEAIDPAERTVTAGGRTLAGDAIIIALGAELAPETIPGLGEAGQNLYSIRGAETIRDALRSFRSGRVVVLTAAPAYKCPAAPYEAAMLIETFLRHQGVRSRVGGLMLRPGPISRRRRGIREVRQLVEATGSGITLGRSRQRTLRAAG
jgi:sulfide:quinone oxidoreductase